MLIQGNSTLFRFVIVLLLGTCAVGCKQTPAVSSPPPPKVEVSHPVIREITDEDAFNGWLRASSVVEVRSRVRGYIQKVHFQDGDMVQANQLLFELDPRPFQVQIDQAHAHAVEPWKRRRSPPKRNWRATQNSSRPAQSASRNWRRFRRTPSRMTRRSRPRQEEVKQYELDLEFSRITAPIAGRISRAHAHRRQPGECRGQRSAADDDCGDRPHVRVLLGR